MKLITLILAAAAALVVSAHDKAKPNPKSCGECDKVFNDCSTFNSCHDQNCYNWCTTQTCNLGNHYCRNNCPIGKDSYCQKQIG